MWVKEGPYGGFASSLLVELAMCALKRCAVVKVGIVISEVCEMEACMTRMRASKSSAQKDTRHPFV